MGRAQWERKQLRKSRLKNYESRHWKRAVGGVVRSFPWSCGKIWREEGENEWQTPVQGDFCGEAYKTRLIG